MNLQLNEAEVDLLLELLKIKQHELPIEVHHTKHREFKELLKEREKLVDGLLAKLGQQ